MNLLAYIERLCSAFDRMEEWPDDAEFGMGWATYAPCSCGHGMECYTGATMLGALRNAMSDVPGLTVNFSGYWWAA